MSDATPQQLIDHLDRLLDFERTALLEGDLDGIVRLAQTKEALINALNEITSADQENFKALQDKVARNQVLLSGALQGIRKVANRIAALRRVRRSLETYDSSGRKQTIQGEVDHKIEKRA